MGSYCSTPSKLGRVRLLETSALQDIANRLRVHCIRATNAAGSGHPTSCSSMAEITAVLFFHTMRYKVSNPRDPSSDRFVLSKGHAAPILYAAWAEAGLFPVDDLLNLRKVHSDLEGHPTPRLNFVDVATGSLGQGLSCAAGMAYVGKYFDKTNYHVYCVIGDGESAEGSIWEALSFASFYKLNNLVAVFDINRLGQSDPTILEYDLDIYKARLESFGFHAYVVDGHNIAELCKRFEDAKSIKEKPVAILAKTCKGKRFPEIEDQMNWHGKPLGDKGKDIIKTLQEELATGSAASAKLIPSEPNVIAPELDVSPIQLSEGPKYTLGDKVATRFAYGTALVKLGQKNNRIIALDGDTKNSTFSIRFKQAYPERFIECFIAEQNLVGVAVGCATRGRTIPFISTFATFFTRAADQLRMAAISQANITCCGSHCGVSIGEDGPSQMGLEDLSLFRCLPRSTVFYPSDAVSTEFACQLAANREGISYIRTSRPETPVLYANDEVFEIGKAKVVRKSENDVILIIGAGITLHESLKAADVLIKEQINIRVIDPFTIKPLDKETILCNARECGGKVLTVEDHYPEGGLGDAVCQVVSTEKNIIVTRLAVNNLPRSGPGNVLLEMFGIGSSCIVSAVREMMEK